MRLLCSFRTLTLNVFFPVSNGNIILTAGIVAISLLDLSAYILSASEISVLIFLLSLRYQYVTYSVPIHILDF